MLLKNTGPAIRDWIIRLLEQVPRTRWWTLRVRRERIRWIESLENLSRVQSAK